MRERHAETEKIETLGSSRMTKILEEIGAESGAGGIKGEEKKIVSAFVKRRSRSMRTIYVCTIASVILHLEYCANIGATRRELFRIYSLDVAG